ncbi:MAG: aspartate--tRNA ligase [Gemmatimonadetes bacterium]|nr:aspartate--tRNA ligase [Gemmatimonadota bacterium]
MTRGWERTAYRTRLCGDLRASDSGSEVRLAGWVHRVRDLGGLVFIDLRDRSGVVQVACRPGSLEPAALAAARKVGEESVIAVRGRVVRRPESAVNPELPTGEVEVEATELLVLSAAATPPIPVAAGPGAGLPAEELRLAYRYLDLRRPELLANFVVRHGLCAVVREVLSSLGFLEVETPLLTRPTPEGARDYLVPSRTHRGEFYALPQSPQLYKQILMVAGFDRYFQIARCLRDEDLRHDRQPEFTQVDVEMSFVAEDDVFAVAETLLPRVWKELAGVEVEIPFARIPYREVVETHASDKPDLRIPWPVRDLTAVLEACEFRLFRNVAAAAGRIRGFAASGAASLSRRELDALDGVAREAGAGGALWLKWAGGEASGPFAKHLNDGQRTGLLERAEAKDGDVVVVVAGADAETAPALDALRRHLATVLRVVDAQAHRFAWVTEFALFERERETGRILPARHPFTSPLPEDVPLLESDPLAVRARAYDLVYNGNEIGSGSIRMHDPALQKRVFRAFGLSDEEAEQRFGFLLEALRYGAPPHGGFALGLDRMAMLLAGAGSLRDVIAFPKTTAARALMEGAPAPADEAALKELSIQIVQERSHV